MIENKRHLWIVNCTTDNLTLNDRIVYSCLLWFQTNKWKSDYKKIAQLTSLDWESVQTSINRLRDLELINGLTPAQLAPDKLDWFVPKKTADPTDKLFYRLSSWQMFVRPAKGQLSRVAVAILSYCLHRRKSPNWKPKFGFTYAYVGKCLGVDPKTVERLAEKYKWLWKIDNGIIEVFEEKINPEWFANCFTKENEKPEVEEYVNATGEFRTETQVLTPEHSKPKTLADVFIDHALDFEVYYSSVKLYSIERPAIIHALDTEPDKEGLCEHIRKQVQEGLLTRT